MDHLRIKDSEQGIKLDLSLDDFNICITSAIADYPYSENSRVTIYLFKKSNHLNSTSVITDDEYTVYAGRHKTFRLRK